MALVERQSATLVFQLVDETGSRSNLSLDIPRTTLASAAFTAAGALIPLVNAITDCAVVGYSLNYGWVEDAPPAPSGESRVERKGVFVYRTNGGKTAQYQVPGINGGLVDASGSIEVANPAVAAFIAGMVGVNTIFCDSNGQDLTSLKSAYELFRTTKKGQMPPKLVY